MNYCLKVKQKLSVTQCSEEKAVTCAGENGVFEAQAITFARTAANAHIRQWSEEEGLRMRTQKEWAKNLKTKNYEKQVMVQNGTHPETYVFVLEQLD